ncbi:hypothetical protein BDZ89DRAFT_1111439 [Hymenopellis radicata]|nr:hypothetical protein BDZ89DRAFT_1111439 [Hymenopellis radicata]
MDPELEKAIMKAVNKFFDYEYEPYMEADLQKLEHWEHVDVGSELDDFFSNLALPPIDALTSPHNFSLAFDASVPLTGLHIPQFCETDTQTPSPDFSSRSDAYNDFHEDRGRHRRVVLRIYPPLPSPTPSEYSLPTFTDIAQYNASAPEPQYLLSSHYSQSSTNVIAPSVANSANPAANQRTGMPFASWNNEPSYPPPHRPAAFPTQPFIIPPPPGATYLNDEDSELFGHFHGEILFAHPQQQQSQGSIHPSGQVRDHSVPYEWPQVDDGSESGKKTS